MPTALWYRFDHVSDEVAEKAIEEICRHDRYYITKENPNNDHHNVHYHCYILASRGVSKWRTFMNGIGLKGPDHSCKLWDDGKDGIAYYSKGAPPEPPVVIANNYLTDEEIEAARKRYWEKNAELKQSSKRKRANVPWSQALIQEMVAKYEGQLWSAAEIFDDVYLRFGQSYKPYRQELAASITDTIRIALGDTIRQNQARAMYMNLEASRQAQLDASTVAPPQVAPGHWRWIDK